MNATTSGCSLIGAALSHLALKRAAASVLPVPDTDPPLFVAVGPAPAIAQLLQAAVDLDRAVDAGDLTAYARAKQRQDLARRAVMLDDQYDHSEGGHHD